jgi:hypothetical protein
MPKNRIHVLPLALPAVLAIALASPQFASADTFSDIRYTDLVARLGAATPTGAGIGIGQVEAQENAGGSYAPDPANAEFAGVTIFALNGTVAPSWHGTEVARNLFGGTSSIARDSNLVYVWRVNEWVGTGYLRVGQGTTAPAVPPNGVRVFNHSWIGSFGSTTSDNDGLRRLDFLINRDNIFVSVGTNNGAGSTGQPLVAYGYNAMSVGLPTGAHSNSLTPTGIDGPGRRKPDIVAPGSFTSFGTPVVGAAAALLFQTATTDPAISGNPNANRSLTVKSVMLAGANHRTGWANNAPQTGASRGVASAPLDPLYGVDLLDIDRAHRILTAGESEGSATALPSGPYAAPQGWDYIPSVASGASVHWTFRVSQLVPEMSVVATWYRQVATNFTSSTLQDLDLKLWRVVDGAPAAISGDAGIGVFAAGNCESTSAIDNVEHLYLRNLAPGDYVLELKRKTGTQPAMPVSVSWYLPTTFPTGDINQDGVVGAPDLAELLGQWGTAGSADLNGDGVVNASDLGILLANWG